MVAVSVGVGLLAFGAPAGLPPLGGAGAFCAVVALLSIVFGALGFTGGLGPGGGREKEPAHDESLARPNPPAAGGVEAKLRELRRLKEEKLITEDEYQRKRADTLEKW